MMNDEQRSERLEAGDRRLETPTVQSSSLKSQASSLPHHSVRAVLFDAVGTLIRPAPSVAAAYAQAARRHGVELAEEEISRRFHRAFKRQDELDQVEQSARHQPKPGNRALALDRGRGIRSLAALERIFADLWEHFAAPAHWRLFDDAANAWRQLAAAGLTLGIASNFDDRLPPICRQLAPLDCCQHLFVSSQLGWRKPASEFFAAIAERLNLAPEELLFVGDDVDNDYGAACRAGWQAVLLDRTDHERDVSVPAEQTIRSLAELVEGMAPTRRMLCGHGDFLPTR